MSLNKNDIRYYLLCLYTMAIMFSDNTIIMYGVSLLFGSICLLFGGLGLRVVKINEFALEHYLFTIFCFFCAVLGFARLPSVSINRCVIMAINIFIGICVSDIIKEKDNYQRFIIFFVKLVLIYEAYILLLTNVKLFEGRLGQNLHSPIAQGGIYNSNIVGCTLLFALIYVVSRYSTEKKLGDFFNIAFLILGILLTGSRKAIICSIICLLLIPVLYIYKNNKNSLVKFMKFSVISLIVAGVIWYTLFNIPAFYNIAGYRIEALLINIQDETVYADSSMKYRDFFIDYAKTLFNESPWIGVGIDNFRYLCIFQGYYAHNNYWEILSGTGIIGFILYYLSYFIYAVKLRNAHRNRAADLIPAIVFFVIMIMIDYYMVSYLQRIVILLFFVNYGYLANRNVSDMFGGLKRNAN